MNGIRTKGSYMCDSAFLSAKFVKGFSSTGNGLEVGGSNSKNSSAGIRPTTQSTIWFPNAIRESSRITCPVDQGPSPSVDCMWTVRVDTDGRSMGAFSGVVGSGSSSRVFIGVLTRSRETQLECLSKIRMTGTRDSDRSAVPSHRRSFYGSWLTWSWVSPKASGTIVFPQLQGFRTNQKWQFEKCHEV